MREIKFRGKRIDNGEWVYGYYVAYRVTGGGKLYHYIKNTEYTYKVVPETVGQFLEHKDVCGIPMYEGDILENYYEARGVIEFDTDRFLWIHGENWGEIEPKRDKLEIIGIIHDNPELLK